MATGLDLLRESAAIVAAIDAPDGADADAIDARLAAWLSAAEDKIAAYWAATRRIDAEDSELHAIADRITGRRRALASARAHVADMATALLLEREAHGFDARERRPEFSAWLATTSRVDVPTDAASLPPQYRRERTTITADRDAIRAAIEGGETVDGCAIIAARGVRWR